MSDPQDEFKAVLTESLKGLEQRTEQRMDRRIERLERHVDDRLREFEKRFDLRFQQIDERMTRFERHIDNRLDDLITALEEYTEGLKGLDRKLTERIERLEANARI